MKNTLNLFALLAFALSTTTLHSDTVNVPPGINHDAWDDLVSRYVDDEGLVNYEAWKENSEDIAALDGYLAQYAPEVSTLDENNEAIAALINAYNAFTIQWILQNYPTESIKKLRGSWNSRRHLIGGRQVSLDEIEHDTLRPLIGWKVHAVVVCAARSCPPLYNQAFIGDILETQIEERYRAWLAREDLNAFDRGSNRIAISKIFSWYEEDYTEEAPLPVTLSEVLSKYAPESYKDFLASGDYSLDYKDYHWGLNDQGDLGIAYQPRLWDSFF